MHLLGKALAIAFSGVLLTGLVACGSDPVCGDGKTDFDLDEQCDDGNADDTDFCLSTCQLRAIPQLTIKWEFNQDLDRGFQGDSCFDLGAENVTVRLTGPNTDQTDTIQCSFRQVRYEDLAVGAYTAAVTVTTAEGGNLLSAPFESTIDFAGGVGEEAVVVVPPTSWLMAYVGNYFFRLGWGDMGDSCEVATPPVVDNSLLLLVGGIPYPGQTDVGHPVDGSAFSPCRLTNEANAQAVLQVPFGPAEITITGRDSVGTITHTQTFPTFVGAGVNNPEMRFDVASVGAPDAGVDASIDATAN